MKPNYKKRRLVVALILIAIGLLIADYCLTPEVTCLRWSGDFCAGGYVKVAK